MICYCSTEFDHVLVHAPFKPHQWYENFVLCCSHLIFVFYPVSNASVFFFNDVVLIYRFMSTTRTTITAIGG